MSLRLLLFAHRLSVAAPTGIYRYSHELTRALSGRRVAGVQTDWAVCAPREPHPPSWVPANVEVRRVPGPRRPVNVAWATVGRPRLERLTGPFDLLHVLTPVFPVPTGRPLVVTVHDVLPLTHPHWYSRRERWLNGAALRQAAAAAHVITPSAAVAAEVGRVLGVPAGRLTVVPEGVRVPSATPADRRAATLRRLDVTPGGYLLYVGAISTRKNLPVLLQALAQVPGVPLVAVGPHPPEAASTFAATRRWGLAERVRFPGFVTDDELAALLADALALVHPSSYEGFGLTPLEAMAAGTPVISSNAGALPEVVAGAGLLIDPGDPQAWASAVARLRDDRELADRLRREGRRRAGLFSWSHAAERTLAVYQRVLSDGGTSA